jgi:hypothetical protein
MSSSPLYIGANPAVYEVPFKDNMLPLIQMLTEVDKDFTRQINSDSYLRETAATYIQGKRSAVLTAHRGFKNREGVAIMQKKRLEKYSNVLPSPQYQQLSYKVNEELMYALKLAQPFVGEFGDMRVLVEDA